jgi:hypothetical protein
VAFDLVVRGGTVVDGTGAPRVRADVGVVDGRVAEIGTITEAGRQEIDAEGLFVTPGFVDSHTHLDAQICWDPLGPSAPHGVTSVVAGNCGIAVAPCHDAAEREVFVMPALEIAEDIHRPTVEAGVDWRWETFADYLAVVDALPKGINFGACVGHGTLRSYVLGDRAYDEQGATAEEIAAMCRELGDALQAGALGFTSMLPGSGLFSYYGDADVRDMDPRIVCGLASREEVDAITEVLASFGRGGVQLGGAYWDDAVRLAARSGLPVRWFGNGSPDPLHAGTCRRRDRRGWSPRCRRACDLGHASGPGSCSTASALAGAAEPEFGRQRAALLDPAACRAFEIARNGPFRRSRSPQAADWTRCPSWTSVRLRRAPPSARHWARSADVPSTSASRATSTSSSRNPSPVITSARRGSNACATRTPSSRRTTPARTSPRPSTG